MKLDSIFHFIENIELDKLMINDLPLLDFAYWEFLLPICASLLAPYIVNWTNKLKRNIRIKSYSKSQINNVKPVQELPKQSFISVVNNSMLKNEYFVVKTLDIEKPFIIPFPTSKREELVNNNFVVVYENNMIFELRDALNKYISTYYATDENKLFINNEEKDIDKFISNQYWRFRFGVGRPNNNDNVSSYVLSDFSLDELAIIKKNSEVVFNNFEFFLKKDQQKISSLFK